MTAIDSHRHKHVYCHINVLHCEWALWQQCDIKIIKYCVTLSKLGVHITKHSLRCFHIRGLFLDYRELSAILDPNFFPTFLRTNSWVPFSWLLRPAFYRTLRTVNIDFLVKKLGAVALTIHKKSTPVAKNKVCSYTTLH